MRRFDKLARAVAGWMRGLQHAIGIFPPAQRGAGVGVAEERQTEETLRNFSLIVDSIPVPVAVTTPDGEVEALNRATLDYFGKTLEELKGWTTSDVVHPDDLQDTVAKQRRAHETGSAYYSVESRHRRADGVYRWFNVLGLPLRDMQGRVLHWLHLQIDIEDRKRAEEALRASEINFRQIVDSIPGLVCTLSPSGELELLNRQLLEYFGKTLEDLKDWATSDIIHPDDRPRAIGLSASSISARASFDIELRCRRADGIYRWFQASGRPARREDGGIARWYVLVTDINDRKQAEDKLRRNEAFLAEGQRLSSVGNFSWPLDTNEIAFSEELSRIFEFERDASVTLERISGRVHPDDIPLLSAKIDDARNGGGRQDYEIRLRMPDGSIKYLHTISRGIRHQDGRLEFAGAVQDVTQRRLAEMRSRIQETYMAEAQRLSHTGSFGWNVSSGELFWSEETFRTFGYDAGATPTVEMAFARVHPGDMGFVRRAIERAVAERKNFDLELRLLLPDGSIKYIHVVAQAVSDEYGQLQFMGASMDVTLRRAAEEALRQSEHRYRSLFNHMPVAMWQYDPVALGELFEELRGRGITDLDPCFDQDPDLLNGMMDALRVVEVNDHAVKLFGARDRDELLGSGRKYWEKSPDTFRRAMVSRFRGEASFQEETRFLTFDGREIDALFADARLEGGLSLAGMIDITDRARAQERLQQAQADFAHAARLAVLGELTASIAHEVNQPLAAIRTNSQTALRWLSRSEPSAPKALELIQRLIEDAGRAAEIIARIRAMAAGRTPQRAPLALHDVIEDSLAFLRQEFQWKGVSVSLDLSPALPPVVGDRTQLQQVVVNLAINAMQAMLESPRRSIFIQTALEDPNTVSCVIEDSGPGIDPAHLPRLFDSFFTTKEGGMGMGLPICRSIVEAHEGSLRADNNSVLGGARFSFALPANTARQVSNPLDTRKPITATGN